MTVQLTAITGAEVVPPAKVVPSRRHPFAGGTNIARGLILLNKPSLKWLTNLVTHSINYLITTVFVEQALALPGSANKM